MTDKEKLDKLVAEIERLYHQSLVDENRQAEWGLSSAACTSYGKSKVCKELLSFTDSMQKEPKECMYSKDNYTDEDRKVLCDGCEDECKLNKKEEPVSEELEEAARRYATEGDEISGLQIIEVEKDAFIAGAKWQKERIMANSTNATIGLPYENKYGGYTHLIDVSRPLSVGNNIIAIIFKED